MPSGGSDLSYGTPFRHAALRVPEAPRDRPRWRLISSPRLARLRDGVIAVGALLMLAAIFIPRPVIHRIAVPICAPGDLHPYHLCIRAEDVPVPEYVDLSTGLMLALGFAFVGVLLGVAPWHTRSPEARLRDDRGERLCALLALVFAASGFVGTTFFAPESFTRPVYTLLFLAAWAVTLMTRTR